MRADRWEITEAIAIREGGVKLVVERLYVLAACKTLASKQASAASPCTVTIAPRRRLRPVGAAGKARRHKKTYRTKRPSRAIGGSWRTEGHCGAAPVKGTSRHGPPLRNSKCASDDVTSQTPK